MMMEIKNNLYVQENTHAHRNRSFPQRLAIAGSIELANQRRTLDEKEFKEPQVETEFRNRFPAGQQASSPKRVPF
jgi:hypothetical protein